MSILKFQIESGISLSAFLICYRKGSKSKKVPTSVPSYLPSLLQFYIVAPATSYTSPGNINLAVKSCLTIHPHPQCSLSPQSVLFFFIAPAFLFLLMHLFIVCLLSHQKKRHFCRFCSLLYPIEEYLTYNKGSIRVY